MAQKKRNSKTKPAALKMVEPEVIDNDCTLDELQNAFRLNLGTDIDKMLNVVTGKHRCPKIYGERASITGPFNSTSRTFDDFDKERYDFSKETGPLYRQFSGTKPVSHWVTKQSYKSMPTNKPAAAKNESASKIVVNIPAGWTVTVNGGQVIMEAPQE